MPAPERYCSDEESYDPDKYKGLLESAKKQTPRAVELTAQYMPIVMDVVKKTIVPYIRRPSIVSIDSHHVHILVELVGIMVPKFCKLAKGRSTTALRKSGFKEMKWARGYNAKFIESDEEARNVWRYISRHKRQGKFVERIDLPK